MINLMIFCLKLKFLYKLKINKQELKELILKTKEIIILIINFINFKPFSSFLNMIFSIKIILFLFFLISFYL
jgi:hypothetical protein